MSGGDVVIAAVHDVFVDTEHRPYAAMWRWSSARPLEVELHLVLGRGKPQVWRFARDLLAPGDWPCPEADIALAACGERLLVVLYPLTSRTLTLSGSRSTAQGFLAATECAVPRCPGCGPVLCAECGTVDVSLDQWLAEVTRGARS